MARLLLEDVGVDFPLYHLGGRVLAGRGLSGRLGRGLDLGARRPVVHALDAIDLDLREGDRLALIGPNGSGKTTLLRTMAGVYEPMRGRVVRIGRVVPLLTLGLGMNLELSGLDNVSLLAMHLDIPPRDIRNHVEDIVEWTELGAFIDAPVRTYSAGMMMRLAFAVSTALPPEILLMDEWVGLGDADFQLKAYERMAAFVGGAAILVLASHSSEILQGWCNRAVRLESGRAVGFGPVADLLASPAATEAVLP